MRRVGLGLLLSALLHGGALSIAVALSRDDGSASPPAAQPAPLELVRIDVLGRPPAAPPSVTSVERPAPAPVTPAPARAARARPSAPRSPVVVAEASAPETAPTAGTADKSEGGIEDVAEGASGGGAPSGIAGTSAHPGAPGAGAGAGAGAGTGQGSGEGGLDADQRAQLHARLSTAARVCYPPAARRFRLTGEVLLSFCLDGKGGFHTVRALQASGSDLLDRAAVECVLPKAAPLPGPATCLRVPVQFRQDR